MHVLVAEHDTNSRNTLATTLSDLNYRVTSVGDSTALLRTCLKGEVDVVMLDLNLQPIPGVEAISLIREIDDQILIVPMAHEDRPSLEFAVRSLGIFCYLLKPVSSEEVFAVLKSAEKKRNGMESDASSARGNSKKVKR